ncbi:MAG TPA: serine--tRNA ligase, partial [Actinomycetota bacterium]|nr:serine--tRNA ligase [Actinomycetota bacterium]
MIDLKSVREDPAPARAGLARRGRAEDLDRLLAIDEEWRGLTAEVEALRAEQNRVSKEVGRAEATERERLIASVRDLTDRLSVLEARLADVAARRDRLLLEVPNPPHPSVPDGESDEDNEVVRVVGQVPERPWAADHVDLGTALGVLDLDRAVRLSGSRFAYLTGPGVWLEFALVRYALDLVAAKGFVPVVPPVLVREEAMYGTGFLPADEAQIYVTREDGLYLVGTSEVALAGLHQEEI